MSILSALHLHPETFFLLVLLAAILAALLGIYALMRRRTVEGATAFAVCMAGISIWSLGYALELAAPTLPEKLFWARVQYGGIVVVPLMWLIFVIQYVGLGRRITRRHALALGGIPAFVLLMVWTNDLHHLHWRTMALRTEGVPLPTLQPTYGPVFWVHTAYSYGLLIAALILLMWAALSAPKTYRQQIVILLGASVLVWLANGATVIGNLANLPLVEGLDLTPLFFPFSGLLAAWGIFGLRMLDIAPVARHTVVQELHDAMFVVGTDDRLVDLNPAAERLWGRPAAELLGQPIEVLLAGRGELLRQFKDVLEAHTEIALHVRGEVRHYDLSITPLRGPRGLLRGRVVVLHDITPLKQAEQVRRESEERYRLLLSAAFEGITVLEDGVIVDCNRVFEEMFGYERSELIGLSPEHLVIPEDRKVVIQRIRKHYEGLYEVTGLRKDGSTFPLEVRAREATYRGRAVRIAALRDLTEYRRAQEALGRRDAILEALAYASQQLLLHDVAEVLPDLLAHLGQAAGVSRAYIFENHTAPDGALLTSQRYEWAAPGQTPQIDNPDLQNFPYVANGFERWVEVLGAGRPLYGVVREFPASERPVLEAQGILSILIVPIFSEGKWWGFLGFDECTQERIWAAAEVEALRSVANALGAAFARQRIQAAEREQRALAEALRDTAAVLNSTLDRDTVFDRILENVGRVVPHDAANIMLIEEGVARIVRWRGYEGRVDLEALQALRFRVDETPNLRHMVETGEPFVIPDVREYADWVPVPETTWVGSNVGVPIQSEGKVLGFLFLDCHQRGFYTPEHAERLKAFAYQAAVALRNAELYAESQHHIRQLALLNEITRVGTATLDLDELLETLVQTAARIIGGDGCFITLWDAQNKRTLPMASSVVPSEVYRKESAIPGEVTVTESVLKAGRPLAIEDVFNTPYVSRRIAERFPEKSVLALPLRAGGRDLGALIIAFMETHRFSEEEIAWAQQVADLVALSISRAQAYADLVARNRDLDAFGYTAAHDLKAPLSVAIGYLELLKEVYADQFPDEAAPMIRQIDLSLHKMLQIIESLLLLARVRSAEMAVQPVAMEPVIHAAQERFKEAISARGIRMEVQPPLPPVLGYGPWLEEVMANLISNAVKYAGGEGKQPLIAICAVPQGSMVRYEVRDNGPGIAPEDQERIFEMFTRLHGGRTEGVGLGLSIVKRVIEKLGGQVGIESKLGEGSTFWFTLPAVPIAERKPTAE